MHGERDIVLPMLSASLSVCLCDNVKTNGNIVTLFDGLVRESFQFL